MDKSAADRRRPRTTDASEEGQKAASKRLFAAVKTLGARWWQRLGGLASTVGRSVRHAGRFSLRRHDQTASDRPRSTHPYSESRRVDSPPLSVGTGGATATTLAEAEFDTATHSLRNSTGGKRRLTNENGRLQVERTPERLILYDPESEEAYLASTEWADVES